MSVTVETLIKDFDFRLCHFILSTNNLKWLAEKKIIDNSQMRILVVTNITEVVKYVNEENIKKEDIISLLKDNGQWMLVYYK